MDNPSSYTITDDGYKMFLDDIDSLLLSKHGFYDLVTAYVIRRLIHRGDTVLDIGAHIGYYTLIASEIVGEDGKVFAFEPNPTNFALLKRNVEENECDNVTLVNKAVSNKNGITKLYICADNTGDHRIYNIGLGWESVDVETIRLDDYFKDEPIDFIKMDVQGAEGLAIEGMSSLLQKNNDVKIVTEFCADMIRETGVDPSQFLKRITKNNKKLYFIPINKITVEPISIDGILEKHDRPATCIDLVCMKNLQILHRGK
jgi:FkbM family methyltransferase